MKSKLILIGLVAVAFGGGVAWAEEPATEVPAVQRVLSQDAFLDSLAPDASAPACESKVAAPFDLGPAPVANAKGCAKPECRRDRDCDSVCGEGWGVCQPDDTSCHTLRCFCVG